MQLPEDVSFQAIRVSKAGALEAAPLLKVKISELSAGEVVIQNHFSCINYKDALAVTGQGKILRRKPLNPGIDAAGEVIFSADKNFVVGQKVFATGCGLGETLDGGFSEVVRLPADIVVPLPQGLDCRTAMTFGTAGFTAGLALQRMEQLDQAPDLGPVVVTGASGGVGSFATLLLRQKGYQVHAVTGKQEAHEYLKSLGAHKVMSADQLGLSSAPLGSVKFGGAIDNVGGGLLAKILAHTQLWGNVCSIGLADRADYKTTVMPMILRGVNLLGVSSANCPKALRLKVWKILAESLSSADITKIQTTEISLSEVYSYATKILDRKNVGRVIVKF